MFDDKKTDKCAAWVYNRGKKKEAAIMERAEIKTSDFMLIGYIETDSSGNKTVRDRNMMILGYYEKNRDATMDNYRRIIAYGDVTGVFFSSKIRY